MNLNATVDKRKVLGVNVSRYWVEVTAKHHEFLGRSRHNIVSVHAPKTLKIKCSYIYFKVVERVHGLKLLLLELLILKHIEYVWQHSCE